MLRLYLILAGIGLSVFIGIFWLRIESTTPFQLMEWDIYGQTEPVPAPVLPAPAEIGAGAGLPAVPLSRTWDKLILHEVPFAAQAPFGEWSDPRYQDGCEEASVLMAIKAARQEDLSRESARDEIARLSQFQLDNYGSYVDTSASATLARLVEDYFKYQGRVEYGIDKDDIIAALADNNLVLVPTNGQRLANPNYSPPGPLRHMLVIRGYDPAEDIFITNDPGTRQGDAYEYDSARLIDAIVDYPTGDHLPAPAAEVKAMIMIPL